MGCLKLTYYQENGPLLKCVWNKNRQEKPVQWFYTVDPLAEKYYSISPYVYCANNPVIYVDPDGQEIIISGDLIEDAFRQLQARMKDRITLLKDENGKLGYTINEGQRLKGVARRMANIIDDNSITVNLITTGKTKTSTGELFVGGAFMGNVVTTNDNGERKVIANQEVNPNVLGRADAHTQTPGKMIMHEVTEAYAGAQISQKEGTGVGTATNDDASNSQSVFYRAHSRATLQSEVYETIYKTNGYTRIEWSVKRKGKYKTIQTNP